MTLNDILFERLEQVKSSGKKTHAMSQHFVRRMTYAKNI